MEQNLISIQDLQDLHSYELRGMWSSVIDLPHPDQQQYKLKSYTLKSGFDGLVIASDITNQTYKWFRYWLKPYVLGHPNVDTDTKYKITLDYYRVLQLAIHQGLLINDTDRDDYKTYPDNHIVRQYKSSFRQDLDTKQGKLQDMHQSVTLTFTYKNDYFWNLKIWINPNKFVKDYEYQKYEPLYWFFINYIRPKLDKPYLKEIHLNMDLKMPWNKVYLKQAKRKIAFDRPINARGSKYINNATDVEYQDEDQHKPNFADTIIVYDKDRDIGGNNHKCLSYISSEDIKYLNYNNQHITRFEFRTYKPKQSAYLLNGNRALGGYWRVIYRYKDYKGNYREHDLKNALNKAYKHGLNLVKDNIIIDDEIIENTIHINDYIYNVKKMIANVR